MALHSIHLLLGSRAIWLDTLQGMAEDLAEQVGLDEDDRFAVAMAVREGVNNAILHGNQRDESKSVDLTFFPHPDRLEIRIRDEGPGFDQARLPNPLAPENLLNSSGRGVFLIRSYMDEVDLAAAGRQGGEIRMVKWIRERTGRPRTEPVGERHPGVRSSEAGSARGRG